MSFQLRGSRSRTAVFPVPRRAEGADGSTYDVLDADGVTLTLRWLSSKEVLEIWSETKVELTRVEFVVEEILEDVTAANRGQDREVVARRRVPQEVLNEDNFNLTVGANLFCAAVVDWSGIEDSKGEDLPCDDENKRALIAEAGGVARWVADVVVDVARFEEESASKEAEADARFRNGSDSARDEVPEMADGMRPVHSGTT